MDFFTEYIVKRKKNVKDYLYISSIITLAIAVVYIAMVYIEFLGTIFFMILIGVIYLAMWLGKFRNVEFEYAFTNGEIDIDRIVAKRKRRRIITVNAKKAELCVPVAHPRSKKSENMSVMTTIDAVGDMEAENAYVMVVMHKGIKTRVYFQPSSKMLEYLEKFVPSRSFEKR